MEEWALGWGDDYAELEHVGDFLTVVKTAIFPTISVFFRSYSPAIRPQKLKNDQKNRSFLAPAENPQHALNAS